MPAKIKENLLEYLTSRSVVKGDCLVWEGRTNNGGYGHIRNSLTLGTVQYVHRLMYIHHNGHIPEGLVVMHSCDNRVCINIDHLSVGTHQDNSNDMVKKGRHRTNAVSGLCHYAAKLDNAKVEFIRKNHLVFTQNLLATVFGVTQSLISHIVHYRHWTPAIGGR